MKPFEIQGAELVLGGVQLQAGNTGVVIPGVTRATSYRVEEVRDTADQDRTFAVDSEVVVVDGVLYNAIVNQTTEEIYADFTATTDDEGYIDEIEVNGRGTYTAEEAAYASSVDMFVYIGAGNASDRPLIPEDWVQIPFRPKMRAGEIEREGGGGGASSIYELDGVSIGEPSTGEALVFDGENWVNQTISGGDGGSSLDPFVTINNDDNVEITTDIVFAIGDTTSAGYIITSFDPNQNSDAYFEASCGDGSGTQYTVGYFEGGDRYALIYATNSDGTKKWETSIDQINGNTPRPVNVVYKNNYVYVGFHYYDGNQDQVGVVKILASDGTSDTYWTLTSPSNSYPRIRDIAVDNDGNPIIVGQIDGERTTITDIVAQSGSGQDMLVVNTIDILPSGDTNVANINWEFDTTGSGNWVYSDEINTFYNLPVVSVQGTGSGMTVNMRYSAGHPTYIWINQQGTGYTSNGNGDYTFGEELKILGSSYGGVDGVNDITMYIWMYNGGSQWTIVAPQQDWSLAGNTPTDKTYFKITGTDWSQNGPWTIRYPLQSQAYVWTAGWQHTFGSGSESEQFVSVSYDDNDGSIYLGGDFYKSSPRRSNALYKLDSSGAVVWSKYIEDTSSFGGQDFGTVALDGTGNVFVITSNDNGAALVHKLNSDGELQWSVRQTNRDSNNYWNNQPRGAVDGNGDVYVIGSWTWDDNRYGVSMTKLSGTDGSLIWARKLNTTDDHDLYEFYNDPTQAFKISGNNIYYAGYTYDTSGNRSIGYALCVSTDGTGAGTYGRWLYEEDSTVGYESVETTLNDELSGSTDGITQSIDESVSLNLTSNNVGNSDYSTVSFVPPAGGAINQVGSITFSDGTTQTTAAGGAISWTSPNDNVWRIETYNGGAAVTYYGGDDYSAKWFDIANHTSGASDFRGAIIQYHAFIQNRGTIIGTIHLSSDYTQQNATHTEHLSGDNDLQLVTLWDCNNERGQLFFKMTNNQTWDAMVQWTSTVFYGQENNY